MARQKIGGKSKRVTCAKRYKIEKKVRQHKKKLKKLNLKTSVKKSKKDPGVPNSCPFKEEVLRQAEAHKERLEVERVKRVEKRKAERSKQVDKKRNLEGILKDAVKRGEEFNRRNEFIKEKTKEYGAEKSVENSLKAYYREVKKVIEAADVIIEVLDARDPLGSRCPQVEQAVLEAGPDKKIILLINKIDLVPKENVEAWLKYLRNEFPTVAFKASTQTQADRLSHSKVPLNLASDELRKSSRCLGADMLMNLLSNYCRNQNIETSITIGLVGFPNTGKSSVINSLKRSRACSVGATPGVTKSMQAVQLDKHIKLLDSPGVVMASNMSDASIVLRNSVRLEALDDPVPAVSVVLSRCTKQQLMGHYTIPEYSDVHEFLVLLAKRFGKLRKHGLPDSVKAAKILLHDWNTGKITYYTQPPLTYTRSSHVSFEIVNSFSKAFDLDALVAQETEALKGLKQTSKSDIVVASDGFTSGTLDNDDNIMHDDEADDDDDDYEDVDDDEKMEDDDSNVIVKTKEGKRGNKKKNVTFKLGSTKSSASSSVAATEGNSQMNKERKAAFKKMKKNRKKSDKLATQLSTALEGSLGGLGGSLSLGGSSKSDDYDFSTDY